MTPLKKRYFAKLLATGGTSAMSLLMQTIVSRSLGPQLFGSFSFLTNFFNNTVNFFDTGTSACLFTRLSQRPEDKGLVGFYLRFSLLIGAGMLALIFLAQSVGLKELLWAGESLLFIYMAGTWGVLSWWTSVAVKIADAYGLTVQSEIARLTHRLIGVAVIAGLWLVHRLTLTTYFLALFFILSVFLLQLLWIIRRSPRFDGSWGDLLQIPWRPYVPDFVAFSRPLLVYGVVSLVTSLFDREILQRFGGDIQQGFFGLAYQVGQICFLFSGTMTPLLTRELAVAHGQEDRERLASLFRRFVPALYAVAAVLSCFACVESRNLAELLGGSKFEGAAPAVAIMALYPIHQTYGQLAGSVFLATDRTKLFSRVTMAGAALSLVPSYLLIAPPSAFGLGLGSVGLALKTVGAQFLTINVLLWFNARFLGQSYLRYLAHQLAAIAVFLGCAYGAMTVVSTGLPAVGSTGLLLHLIATAVLYGVAVLLLIAVCPTLLGLSRGELKAALRSLAGKSLTGS